VHDIGPAVRAVHVGERSVGPPSIKAQNTLLGFILARVPRGNVREIDRQNVRNQDFRWMTAAGSVGPVLVGKVLAKGALGARAILCSAARADLARSVSDDPHRALSERAVGVSFLRPKPEAGAFPGTRHSALISSIAASVV
jgi:hypothetical protein